MNELELIANLTTEFGDPEVHLHTLESGRKFETHCWTADHAAASRVALAVIAAPVLSQISRAQHVDEVSITVFLHREEV